MPHEPGHPAPTPTPRPPGDDEGIDQDLVTTEIEGGARDEPEGSAVGRALFNPDTGEFIGVLTRGKGGQVRRLFLIRPGANPVPFPGGVFLTELGSHVEIDAEGRQRQSRILPTGGAGTGGLSFGERQQLAGEERAFEAEQADLQRQFNLKRDVADRAGALTRELVGLRDQARDLVTEQLGTDVLRGSLGAQGALTIGTTPARAQENVLRGVAAQPIPEALGPEASLSELQQREAELTQRTQGGLPRPGTPLGFAGGTEGTGQGMLVGEAGPEVVEFTPQGTVRVIPLTRKAQGGLEEFDPFEGIATTDPFEQTPAAIGRSLEPVFRELGFGGANVVPLGQTGPFGQSVAGAFGGPQGLQFDPSQSAETFARLGVRPQLLQAEGRNEFFLRTPEGIRPIGGLGEVGALGLSAEQVTVLPFSEITEMGPFAQPRVTEAPPATLQPFAQEPAPLRLPLSVDAEGLPDRGGPSIFLPAPRQLAGIWRTLDPDTKALWGSAWALAGKSREQAARELNFFTPRGTASQFSTAALR